MIELAHEPVVLTSRHEGPIARVIQMIFPLVLMLYGFLEADLKYFLLGLLVAVLIVVDTIATNVGAL